MNKLLALKGNRPMQVMTWKLSHLNTQQNNTNEKILVVVNIFIVNVTDYYDIYLTGKKWMIQNKLTSGKKIN